MWQALLSPITTLLGQVLKNRAEEKNAVHKAKMQVIQNTASWEQLMATASATSWKDEWFTILFSVPCILALFPSMVPVVMQGFAALDGMPDWYKGFLGAAVAASFGIRGLANWKK